MSCTVIFTDTVPDCVLNKNGTVTGLTATPMQSKLRCTRGCLSNGKTLRLQRRNRGSIPRSSTDALHVGSSMQHNYHVEYGEGRSASNLWATANTVEVKDSTN